MKQHLIKSDPFKKSTCSDLTCPVCKLGTGINCKTRDTVYYHRCIHYDDCNGMYVGETSDSIKERTVEHEQKCRQKLKESAHHKHNLEQHKGEQPDFVVKVLGRCPSDPMLRQCMESVCIRDLKPDMNMREEWGNKKPPQR